MTIPRWLYGDPAVTVEFNQYQANVTSKADAPQIHGDRWARNGLAPDANTANALNEGVNQSVLYRSKSVFDAYGSLYNAPSTSSTNEARWYFTFRTGPLHYSLYGVMGLLPAWDSSSTTIRNAAARVDIYSNSSMTSLVKSETFTYGQFSGTIVGFDQIRPVKRYISGLSSNTTYYAKISAVDNARIFGASIFELASMTEAYGGYIPQNLTTHSAILDKYREDQVTVMNDLWRYGGGKVFNWNAFLATSPRTTTPSTYVNLIDNTSTTVTSGTPGLVLDMRGKNRLSQATGVPCVLSALGDNALPNGTLAIKDSSGTVLASVSFNSTFQWRTTTFNLPATVDKYDLVYKSNNTSPLSVYAVGCYELG